MKKIIIILLSIFNLLVLNAQSLNETISLINTELKKNTVYFDIFNAIERNTLKVYLNYSTKVDGYTFASYYSIKSQDIESISSGTEGKFKYITIFGKTKEFSHKYAPQDKPVNENPIIEIRDIESVTIYFNRLSPSDEDVIKIVNKLELWASLYGNFNFKEIVTKQGEPTFDQTIEWINTKFTLWGHTIHYQDVIKKNKLRINNRKWSDGTIGNYTIIEGNNIKSITYGKNNENYWYIQIKGEYRNFYNSKKEYGVYTSFEEDFKTDDQLSIFFLDESVSETDMGKFIKALKYWATLCGAKLVNDELF